MAPKLKLTVPACIYPLNQSTPLRFHVGPARMPYDVHTSVLAADSPAFADPVEQPVAVSWIAPDDFALLTKWLYEHSPPKFHTSPDLGHLCQLWVSAVSLGLWQKANTLMRLGMELMHPKEAICYTDIVRWVFANTNQHSPLRGYIIAIFAQRSQSEEFWLHTTSPFDFEIFQHVADFRNKLEQARKVYAAKQKGSALSMAWNGHPVFSLDDMLALQKRLGGKKEEAPLPELPYLVWDEQAVDVPDCFFIFPGTPQFSDGLAQMFKKP